MPTPFKLYVHCMWSIVVLACVHEGQGAREQTSRDDYNGDAAPPGVKLPGKELSFEVGATTPTLIDLDRLEVLDADAALQASVWDLAFLGWDVFTNSGPSGPGDGAAFGPMSQESFLFATIPDVPFIRADATGGAFTDWYAYDGSAHQLWSRYHVYGIRRGAQLFKVQILGYYGDVEGAPVSAMFQVRYAEVTTSGAGPTQEVNNLDATAGYPKVTSETKSRCLNLSSGRQSALTPAEALSNTEWDLCFRRDTISVNGEEGGPGEVVAVDLSAVNDEQASLEAVQARTASTELQAFESVGYAELTRPNLGYRGDHVRSQFGNSWFEGTGAHARPADYTWLVFSSDGEQHHSLLFRSIEGTEEAASKVTIRAQKLRAPE